MLIPSMLSTNARGFHFGNSVNMPDILPQIPKTILAFGNIDPAATFNQGSAGEVKSIAQSLLESTKEYQNFILSSGCDIPPGTPLENVDAFFAAIDEYGK